MDEYIKQLQWERDVAIQQLEEIGCVLGEDMSFIKKSVDRMKPKRVKDRKIMRDFNGKPYSFKGDCPVCGAVEILSVNTDFCHACGQKLDWSPSNPGDGL